MTATTKLGSFLVIRRLSDTKEVVYENVLKSPDKIGGKVQKDAKGYLITSACNPGSLSLVVNGKPFSLSGTGPWRVTYTGIVSTRMPQGLPPSGC